MHNISQLYGEYTAGYLLIQGRWSHLKTTQALMDISQASETSHSKSRLGKFQYQCLSELLVNVYSYCLMVKSVSYCCVCGRRFSQIQLHIIIIIYNLVKSQINLIPHEFVKCWWSKMEQTILSLCQLVCLWGCSELWHQWRMARINRDSIELNSLQYQNIQH